MTDSSVKTALVTGSSRGIGRATALAMARDGARVIVHYGNSKAEADKVVEEIRSARCHPGSKSANAGEQAFRHPRVQCRRVQSRLVEKLHAPRLRPVVCRQRAQPLFS